ncbi:hypothetical protein CLU79DRAFT_840052 [Phycomyces nitens]|nr:hypothetical protein CLU79DRAFT_840052 [Phycomyces nitens]
MNSTITPKLVAAMQQCLLQLELLATQTQPSAESPSLFPPTMDNTMTDDGDRVATLHSLDTQSSFTWTPPTFLQEVLSLDSPLFPMTLLSDVDCHTLIDQYPNIDGLQYQPPDTVPIAAQKMNRS